MDRLAVGRVRRSINILVKEGPAQTVPGRGIVKWLPSLCCTREPPIADRGKGPATERPKGGAASSGVRPQACLLTAVASDLDPTSELRLVGSGESRQFSLRHVPGRRKKIDFSQADREPRVRGKQIRPVASDLSQLGHGRV
jgi:hypothetical protein